MAKLKKLNKFEVRRMVKHLINESMMEDQMGDKMQTYDEVRLEMAKLINQMAVCAERLEKFMMDESKTNDLPMEQWEWLNRENPIKGPMTYWVDGLFDWYYSITGVEDRHRINKMVK